MKWLTPLGALVICAVIGLLTDRFGLWFPLGMVAAIVVGVVQSRRAKAGTASPQAEEGKGEG